MTCSLIWAKSGSEVYRAGNALCSMRFNGILWTTLSLETSEVWHAAFFHTLTDSHLSLSPYCGRILLLLVMTLILPAQRFQC